MLTNIRTIMLMAMERRFIMEAHCGLSAFGNESSISDACATHVPWGRCQRLELLRRGRWLNQSDVLAPAPESRGSVPPSHILQAPHIAGCARDNCEWFRFHYRDRSGACPSHSSMCGPALGEL